LLPFVFGENLIDRTPPQKKNELNKAHKIQVLSVYYTWNYYDQTSENCFIFNILSETYIMSNKLIKVENINYCCSLL